MLLNFGEDFSNVYILEEGAVRLYYLTPQGNESNKLFLFEDNIMLPIAPIARCQPSLFAIATCESSCFLYLSFHEFKQRLIELQIWQDFYLIYLEWLVDAKVQREQRLLTLNKTELIRQLVQNDPRLIQRINDYHLASYLGMSAVTFCRLKERS